MTRTTYAPEPASVDALASDGTIVTVRPATSRDTGPLAELFGHGSAASLRLRFFASPRPALLAAEVRRLTRPPSSEHATLVAEQAGDVVGVASYERRGPEEPAAEFALYVDDAHQGRGIGTLLLEHLAGQARTAGIRHLNGQVLAANVHMLRVAADMAATTTPARNGDGVVEVTLSTVADERALAAIDERDQSARRASLRPLLAPRSVAVVGAGRRPGGVGHEVLQGLVGYGFTGPVYPVNPNAEAIAGVPAYASLSELPGPVDLVVVAVPADQVVRVVAEAATVGARAAVVLSSGFAEAGPEGRRRQAELLRTARAGGIRLVGPNCLGVVNTDPQVRLDASFAPRPPRPGGLAVASQSGAVGIAVIDHASRSGCGISSFVSLGNKADISGNDLISYWFGDPGTRAVALYLESFGNPRWFARVARALARRKPLLAVFSGRSVAGQRAGASHTAAAATPGVAVDTLFDQAGVVRVDHLGELVDAARMLADQPLPGGNRLGVVGNAGGVNVMVADAAEAHGLRLPEHVGALHNPLDLGAGATPEALAEALSAMAADGGADLLFAVVTATRANDPPALLEAVASVADAYPDTPMAVITLGLCTRATAVDGEQALGDRGVPVYDLPERAVRAAGHAVRYAAWRRQPLGRRPQLPGIDPAAARDAVRRALTAGEGWQDHTRTAEILSAYGVPLVETRTAVGEEEAVAAAHALGYPVVLKAADPTLVHKTDLGAVKLRLADPDLVRTAYRELAAALDQSDPPVLVQPMVRGQVELVAGIVHDPLFGSLVMTGLGGVHTDLLGDRAFRLVPMTDLDAGRMWRSLRGAPLLTGHRGAPRVDTDAVEDLLLRLGRLTEDLPEVAELDLNPVLAGPRGVVAVDAKLRLARTGPEPDPSLRRLR